MPGRKTLNGSQTGRISAAHSGVTVAYSTLEPGLPASSSALVAQFDTSLCAA